MSMPKVLAIRGSFPISREERFLTRRNRLPDATEYRSPEQIAPLYHWQLDLAQRTAAEVQELEAQFLALGGQYESFVFLDPLENLLKWSEDFGQAAWLKSDPGNLAIVPNRSDPFGGNAAQLLLNTGLVVNSVSQELAAPAAGLQLTGSVWLKAGGPIAVPLSLGDGAGESYTGTAAAGAAWQRHWLTAKFSDIGQGTKIVFQFQLPADSNVDVFGAQLVALPSPAPYTRTTLVSGFHPHCRFADSIFRHQMAGFGQNNLRLSIVEFA